MSNINFDNAWLLLTFIPIFLVIVIPFIIAIRKDNISHKNVISLIIHIIMSVFIVLVIARMTYKAAITETNVYVVADVSYSANRNLDKVDEYINNVNRNLPDNSKLGVVCFGKDQELLSDLGDGIRSVKEANVDDSITDIASALTYTSSLFNEGVIKRIVLITDGLETNDSNIFSIVQNLTTSQIYVDAIFLDNNIEPDTQEVQLSSVEVTANTYIGKSESVDVLIRSSYATRAVLHLYNVNNQEIASKAIILTEGLNAESIELDTNMAGEFDYEVEITATNDTSSHNNRYKFTQNVVETINVLVLHSSNADKTAIQRIYNDERFNMDFYTPQNNIPYTLEALARYDEFIISGTNINDYNNSNLFVDNLEICVSRYGKSLITLGNAYTNTSDNEDLDELGKATLDNLGSLLPVNYGNDTNSNRLVTIIIDTSLSMDSLYHLHMAKLAATNIVNMLKETELVAVIGFSGEIQVLQAPVNPTAEMKESIIERINAIEPTQGTFLASALEEAYNLMSGYSNPRKEVYLISDGRPFGTQADISRQWGTRFGSSGIPVSSLNCGSTTGASLLSDISTLSGGYYYYAENMEAINSTIFDEMKNNVTETVIEGAYFDVNIDAINDDTISGIIAMPDIRGFYFSTKKNSGTTVLSVDYTDTNEETNTDITYTVPIYSYWSYGSGRVSTFACNISGYWLSEWNEENNAYRFLRNTLETSIPRERIDSPFIFDVTTSGTNTNISINVPNSNATPVVSLTVKNPDGTTVDRTLTLDSSRNYVTTFDSMAVGKYEITFTYSLGTITYENKYIYNNSYLPEYDSFETYNVSNLFKMISTSGTISEDGNLVINNDNIERVNYTYDFTTIFMIICVVLFIIDIINRKLKWVDVKNIFVKTKKKDKSTSKEVKL